MSKCLYLYRIVLDMPGLFRFSNLRNLPKHTDDYGYIVHCVLAEAFGDQAPCLFSIQPSRGSELLVLAYGCEPIETLHHRMREREREFSVAVRAICSSRLDAKRMPLTWREGSLVGFDTTICPVERKGRSSSNFRPGAEVDAFLNSLPEDGGTAEHSREEVYRDWLKRRISKTRAAELVTARLQGFRLVDLIRRDRSRKAKTMRRPFAVFSGTLRIGESDAFNNFIRHGIGRHRAFGFGMLLLTPAG